MSTPAVGSSRISSRGSCTSARAIISRRFIPPERPRAILSFVPELQLLQVFFGALARDVARDAVETGLVDDDGVRRLELVEVELLRHDADAGLGRFELAVDVVAEDARRCRRSC